VPTGRLTAHAERTGVNQLHQALWLARGQLRAPTAAMTGGQAVHATQQKGLLPGRETRRTEAPALAQHGNGHGVFQEVDHHGGTPHSPPIIAPIGVLKTAVEGFDGGVTALYPETHGCILRSSELPASPQASDTRNPCWKSAAVGTGHGLRCECP
jgi:hypothetical protein